MSITEDNPSGLTGHARTLALANILAATFLTVLNSNMIRVAVPQLQVTFDIGLSWLTWVQNGYSLVYAVLMPVTGRLGDMYGRRRMFLFGVGTFTLGAILSTFSWNFATLILFRAVQAIGSAAIFPNAVIMATSLYAPSERGRILGLWSSVGSVGAVIGPSLGGFLVEYLDWHSVFWVNVPIGIIVFIAGYIQLKETRRGEKKPFDYMGAFLLGLTVFAFLLALNLGNDFGWLSMPIWSLVAVGIVLAVIFVRFERKRPDPMVRLDILTSKVFVVAMVCGMIHMYAGQGLGFLMPLFLVNVQGYSEAAMGMMLLPSAIIRVFSSPAGGSLSDKYGSRPVVMTGMAIQMVTFYLLGILTKTSSAPFIWAALLLNGLGNGLIQSPVLNSVLGSHEASQSGVISGLFNMTRFVGGMIGTAIAGVLLGDEIPNPALIPPGPVQGFYQSYVFSALMMGVGVFAAMKLADPHGKTRRAKGEVA
jgi:EmrB/QacA subfamily drug resistance transporter